MGCSGCAPNSIVERMGCWITTPSHRNIWTKAHICSPACSLFRSCLLLFWAGFSIHSTLRPPLLRHWGSGKYSPDWPRSRDLFLVRGPSLPLIETLVGPSMHQSCHGSHGTSHCAAMKLLGARDGQQAATLSLFPALFSPSDSVAGPPGVVAPCSLPRHRWERWPCSTSGLDCCPGTARQDPTQKGSCDVFEQ